MGSICPPLPHMIIFRHLKHSSATTEYVAKLGAGAGCVEDTLGGREYLPIHLSLL